MGKYKGDKPNCEIETEEFHQALEHSFLNVIYKAYAVLLFWLGCRRSEPLFIRKNHIKERDNALFLTVPALKGGERGGEIELPLTLYGMAYLKQAWQLTYDNELVFPFSDKTGYRIITRLFPNKSPHWLRHNRLTKLRRERDRGQIDTDDIKSFTGIRQDSTIEHYGMKTKKGIHRVAQILTQKEA